MIVLEKLVIERSKWGVDKGTLSGTIHFNQGRSEIAVHVDDESCGEIIRYCAAAIVESSKKLANDLTADALSINQELIE